MGDMVSWANLLVGGGVSAVVVALIGALAGRYPRRADYTAAMVKTANDITAAADKRAKEITEDADRRVREIAEEAEKREQKLEAKIDRLEAKVNSLGGQVGELSDLLRTAIPLLQAAGHEQLAADARAALARRPA